MEEDGNCDSKKGDVDEGKNADVSSRDVEEEEVVVVGDRVCPS